MRTKTGFTPKKQWTCKLLTAGPLHSASLPQQATQPVKGNVLQTIPHHEQELPDSTTDTHAGTGKFSLPAESLQALPEQLRDSTLS